MDEGVQLMTTGIDLPVGVSIGLEGQTGLALAVHRGRILISIVKDGEGLSVWLGGDQIDLVAGMMADKVQEASRFEAPSLRLVQ